MGYFKQEEIEEIEYQLSVVGNESPFQKYVEEAELAAKDENLFFMKDYKGDTAEKNIFTLDLYKGSLELLG